MNDIEKLRQWYVLNKDVLNLAGIEKRQELGIHKTYLTRFVNQGTLYESSLYGILRFALEQGFKFQSEQCAFEIDKETCKYFVFNEFGYIQVDLGKLFYEYKRGSRKA